MKHGLKSIVALALAVGLLTSCAGMGTGGDSVQARRGIMKAYGGNMKAIGGFLKAGKGSAADVAARARKMAAGAEKLKGLFPAGTSAADMPGKTRAKASIWKRKVAFDQAAEIMAVYAIRLADAADSGNKGAIGAAMGQLGKRGCGGCHSEFRGPKPKM